MSQSSLLNGFVTRPESHCWTVPSLKQDTQHLRRAAELARAAKNGGLVCRLLNVEPCKIQKSEIIVLYFPSPSPSWWRHKGPPETAGTRPALSLAHEIGRASV